MNTFAMPTLDLDRESYYNDMGLDTLWTGDIQRSLDISIDIRPPVDVEELDARRRGFERYDLRGNLIRAAIFGKDRRPHQGRLTQASVTGMWIETKHPLPFRAEVDVEWCVMGFSQTFRGRVVRHSDDGMAIHLDTDDVSWRFRSSFIDLARTPSSDPPSVVIRHRKETDTAVNDDALMQQLEHEWVGVQEALDDDTVHQAFIHSCIRGKRLQFALECYRDFKSTNPDSELATRYLKQIGTILSFYTLQTSNQLPQPEKKKIFPIMIIIMVVLAALLLAPTIVQKKLERPTSGAREPNPPGFVPASADLRQR